jgi:hypothetical protein
MKLKKYMKEDTNKETKKLIEYKKTKKLIDQLLSNGWNITSFNIDIDENEINVDMINKKTNATRGFSIPIL